MQKDNFEKIPQSSPNFSHFLDDFHEYLLLFLWYSPPLKKKKHQHSHESESPWKFSRRGTQNFIISKHQFQAVNLF